VVDASACIGRCQDWLYTITQLCFTIFLFALPSLFGLLSRFLHAFEAATVQNGSFTLAWRYIGSCTLIRWLGGTRRSKSGLYHRDISLIMFSKGKWSIALQVAPAIGLDDIPKCSSLSPLKL
jgi:hypothetical protein